MAPLAIAAAIAEHYEIRPKVPPPSRRWRSRPRLPEPPVRDSGRGGHRCRRAPIRLGPRRRTSTPRGTSMSSSSRRIHRPADCRERARRVRMTLARVLEAGGQRVTRSTTNDSGLRCATSEPQSWPSAKAADPRRRLSRRVRRRAAPDLFPELAAAGDAEAEGARAWAAGRRASDRIRLGSRPRFAALGVRFDVRTSEGSLTADGWVDRAIAPARRRAPVEHEGATWFRQPRLGTTRTA
jgi:hypothetical protein